MRAVVIPEFGGPEVLVETELPTPEPGRGQVSIEVSHAAVGLADVMMRRGEFGGALPIVPGLEVAGTVRAVGDGVEGLVTGQAVVTLSRPTAGGYAEVSLADAGVTIPVGEEQDAALLVATLPNATTAVLALRSVAHLAPGERVLVHGASGSLGTVFAQVARALGAGEIVGTVRRPDELGDGVPALYDAVVAVDDVAAAVQDARLAGFDVVVDPVGGQLRESSVAASAPLGRVLCVGNASGAPDVAFGGNELWLSSVAVLGLNAGGLLAGNPGIAGPAARQALELIAGGAVTSSPRTLPLAAAAEAHRLLEEGAASSRLVLVP